MKSSQLKLRILQNVRKSDCYGYEIHRKLAAQGIKIDIGRLYKVLGEMLSEELLVCVWMKSDRGPRKRVYKLAKKGFEELDKMLIEAISTVHEFYTEYLFSLQTPISIFGAFASLAAPEARENCAIAFFAKNPSPLHNSMLTALRDRLGKSEYYAIYPKGINPQNAVENFVYLPGNYEDIPLREKYIDLLIVEGLPRCANQAKAAEEWQRVLEENGRLIIIAPSTVFSFKDPLSIGDYIEKIEHEKDGKFEPGQGEAFLTVLARHFTKVDKKQMLQMTLIICQSEPNGVRQK